MPVSAKTHFTGNRCAHGAPNDASYLNLTKGASSSLLFERFWCNDLCGCFQKWVVPPNHPILIEFSIINHPFWGTPIIGNIHLCTHFLQIFGDASSPQPHNWITQACYSLPPSHWDFVAPRIDVRIEPRKVGLPWGWIWEPWPLRITDSIQPKWVEGKDTDCSTKVRI